MKRRSQPEQKKAAGTYHRKVLAGTHPIISHDRFKPRLRGTEQ